MGQRSTINSEEPTIVIDSREQLPYSFPCRTVVKSLSTGDYSLLGLEDVVTVERKSKADAYGTIGKGRARFVRELERMKEFERSAIVIECSMKDFLQAPKHSKLHPRSAINSLIAWWVRYDVSPWFCDNRTIATACVYNILCKFWNEKQR